jgi:hypothetical protein
VNQSDGAYKQSVTGYILSTVTYFASIYVALTLTFCDKDALDTAINATGNNQRLMLWFI